jgi:hypothetical protein
MSDNYELLVNDEIEIMNQGSNSENSSGKIQVLLEQVRLTIISIAIFFESILVSSFVVDESRFRNIFLYLFVHAIFILSSSYIGIKAQNITDTVDKAILMVVNSAILALFWFIIKSRAWPFLTSMIILPLVILLDGFIMKWKKYIFSMLEKHVDSIGIVVVLNSCISYIHFVVENHSYGLYIMYNFPPIIIVLVIGESVKYNNTYFQIIMSATFIGASNLGSILSGISPILPFNLFPISVYMCVKGWFFLSRLMFFQSAGQLARLALSFLSSAQSLTLVKCDGTYHKT